MWSLLFLLPIFVYSQPPPANMDPTLMAENVDNFRRLYGIATQIMELSGSFMNGQGGSGSSSHGTNSVLGEVRPRFQGVRSFESDNLVTSEGGLAGMARMIGEYGGLFAQASTPTTTTRPSGIQSLLSTFLGSSVDEAEPLPPPPTPRTRQSNLLGLFSNSFAPSSATPMQNFPSTKRNLFGFFGGFMPTTTSPITTTDMTPMHDIFNIFGGGSALHQSTPSPSRLGQINLWELFGVTQRTTTTTQAPLQALLNPTASGGAGEIDVTFIAVLNALMRSNARPARAEPASPVSFLSQLFGGRK
uniref:Uncharacterized protein n=1 Tax=Heterorhabditis bacteriophora TaxID=37862 RepID=A0A1I7XD12_HETBA